MCDQKKGEMCDILIGLIMTYYQRKIKKVHFDVISEEFIFKKGFLLFGEAEKYVINRLLAEGQNL